MSSNPLKLNAEKTEFIWLGTCQQMAKVIVSPLQVKGQLITPLDKVHDPGIITVDGPTCPERLPWLLLPAPATSKCLMVHDNRR